MRSKKDKGPLRNFHFDKKADEVLLLRSNETGRDMVAILEDLLLNRRQYGPSVERFLVRQEELGAPRELIIEAAIVDFAIKRSSQS